MTIESQSLHARAVADRRLFLRAATAAVATGTLAVTPQSTATAQQSTAEPSANDTVVVGVMGVNSRGAALAAGFAKLPGVRVAHICDVDARVAGRVAESLGKNQKAPQITADFRRVLDDAQVDALVVAAPNHWHAPATILGCAAGKHVYVEKPCSQTAEEGEWSLAAARKHKRIVQMGSQRRSWPAIIQAVEQMRSGAIGDVLYARTWYNNRRESIGIMQPSQPSPELDWDLWQGPAPRRPFQQNIVHYNWHWWWHWGNGEIGNNGIHGIDIARWGLDVAFPTRVTAGGGRHRYQDDQQTPDTMVATFDFPEGKTMTWEGLSWSPLGVHQSRFGISFHGTEGSIVIPDSGYTQYDMRDKEVTSVKGPGGDADHLMDFVDAIRTDRTPHCDIEQAHRSTLLCHLGNIAYQT